MDFKAPLFQPRRYSCSGVGVLNRQFEGRRIEMGWHRLMGYKFRGGQ